MIKPIGSHLLLVPPSSENVRTNQVIVTPDGIELVADLYLPSGTPPFPAVIEITPYCAQTLRRIGEIYAARGYLFLAVDSRGRYRSSGLWSPLTYDQIDGQAAIRWMAKHELCNGRIGTRGHSYCGYNQLLAAIDAPAELKAMVVGVAPADPFENVPFQGGAYDLNDFFWLMSMSGRTSNGIEEEEDSGESRLSLLEDETEDSLPLEAKANSSLEDEQGENEFDLLFDQALSARPFRDLDLRFGIRQETFREWISHWQLDDFWKARSVGHRLNRTAVATLHISGWWDGNGRGSTVFFKGMRQQAATAEAREAQRLLIGAWDHDLLAPDCDDLPAEEAAMIQRAALRNALNDELAWFDQHLMGIEPGPSTRSRVTIYLTGQHRWLDFEDWPPPDTQPVNYYLAAAAMAGRRFGRLQRSISATGPLESSYLFDPNDPTPFAHPDVDGERIPFDNAQIEAERTDMLLFDTEPQKEPLALIGDLSLILYARADAPDFDLYAKLLDVYPDGRAIYLTDGIIRARFRKGWDKPQLVSPSEIAEYIIDLWHIGHILTVGHALRLEVSSAAFLRFDINPCTGGNLADETRCRQVRVSILHSSRYPSRLILPICHDPRLLEEYGLRRLNFSTRRKHCGQ
ncbi:MAG: CocE/NonD family hydrolase [bacterium]|nr:CocE/NonD family hydrolase [bacterium]